MDPRPAWVTLGALSIHNRLVTDGTHPHHHRGPDDATVTVVPGGADPTVAPCEWCVSVWTDACEAARVATRQPTPREALFGDIEPDPHVLAMVRGRDQRR